MGIITKIKNIKENIMSDTVVEPVVGEVVVEPSVFREEGETQQEYNERVPIGIQPVLPPVETSYLGEPR